MQQLLLTAGKFNPDKDEIDVNSSALLDFGMRGASSLESAALGSSAYLTSFEGTDTNIGIPLLKNFYGKDLDDKQTIYYGNFLPASEHSTITSWCTDQGDEENRVMHNINEQHYFANHFDSYSDGSVAVACVIDGYNVWNAIYNQSWSPYLLMCLHNYVNKSTPGIVVLRPDSGEGIESLVHLSELYAERASQFTNMVNTLAPSLIERLKEETAKATLKKAEEDLVKAEGEAIAAAQKAKVKAQRRIKKCSKSSRRSFITTIR